jgi:outer membrane protein assembly factor BamE (lipoprotein component of BamABCDE complex)
MTPTSKRRVTHPLMLTLVLFASAFVGATQVAHAQNSGGEKRGDKPLYAEYKGVRIGMDAEEARKKLGNPTDKGDVQDFFVFSEKESAQVFYDKERKVMAVSVNYVGDNSGAPLPKVIVGADIEAKADGAMHKIVRYPEAGYWVSYNRTGGDDPLITVTMQKIH